MEYVPVTVLPDTDAMASSGGVHRADLVKKISKSKDIHSGSGVEECGSYINFGEPVALHIRPGTNTCLVSGYENLLNAPAPDINGGSWRNISAGQATQPSGQGSSQHSCFRGPARCDGAHAGTPIQDGIPSAVHMRHIVEACAAFTYISLKHAPCGITGQSC